MVTSNSSAKPHILVVEDEEFLRNLLYVSLEREGFVVVVAKNGVEAMENLAKGQFDLVLLDVFTPGMDSFDVCVAIRKRSDVPVILVTALNNASDVVKGFELGADDFIGKPFTFREVSARIQAILRRVGWSQERPSFLIMKYGDVVLNDEEHVIVVRGQEVHLTPIEYQLLHYLMSNVDRPVSKDNLYHKVWGYAFADGTNLVEVAMRRLREKVEVSPSEPEYLLTVWGEGYKFADPEKELSKPR